MVVFLFVDLIILCLSKLLGQLSAPPEPELPPSPPTSRSSSPAPRSKRKSSAIDSDYSKRQRISNVKDRSERRNVPPPTSVPRHSRPSSSSANYHRLSEPSEDGELREEPSAPSSHIVAETTVLAAAAVPIRRPRRERPDFIYFDELHRKYHEMGRSFKYSGDARFWSTFPASDKQYRPLLNPPPPNSPYHKYGGLIARLELVDALVCFTYSMWGKEYGRKACLPESWQTGDAFLSWCKTKWLKEDTVGDREAAFEGLM